jgi:ammonium transporter Rh
MYLHGLPGLMGGLAAVVVVDGLDPAVQLTGIAITAGMALVTGYLTGIVLSLFGRRVTAYVDAEEFEDAD